MAELRYQGGFIHAQRNHEAILIFGGGHDLHSLFCRNRFRCHRGLFYTPSCVGLVRVILRTVHFSGSLPAILRVTTTLRGNHLIVAMPRITKRPPFINLHHDFLLNCLSIRDAETGERVAISKLSSRFHPTKDIRQAISPF